MPDARAYASINADAENVTLALGSEVQVVGYNSSWACISQNGVYAFVMLKALSKTPFESISNDGSELETAQRIADSTYRKNRDTIAAQKAE